MFYLLVSISFQLCYVLFSLHVCFPAGLPPQCRGFDQAITMLSQIEADFVKRRSQRRMRDLNEEPRMDLCAKHLQKPLTI